jgi:hypothetical protein
MIDDLEKQARELLEKMGLWEAWTLTREDLQPLMELIEKANKADEKEVSTDE